MNKHKKIFAVLTLACFLFTLMPISAFAGDTESATSGQCGDNAFWEFDAESGTLTISGSGEMNDYWYEEVYAGAVTPWVKYNNQIEKVIILNGIEQIGEWTFANCSKLKQVEFPESLKIISQKAFTFCSGLEFVNFPANLECIEDSAFSYCKNLENIVLPEKVKKIESYAFCECKGGKSLNIPVTLIEIGEEGVFAGWENLEAITIDAENSVYTVEDGVLHQKNENSKLVRLICCPAGREGSYNIPDGVQEIGGQAFYGCSKLTDINISETVSYIGRAAFYDCDNLKYIKIPDGITIIPPAAFGESGLKEIVIPESVTKIEGSAFFFTPLDNIFYGGNEEEWHDIKIGEYNDKLKNSVIIHYNSTDHSYGELIPAQPEVHTETELKAGIAAHYQCSVCETYFTEQKAETTLSALEGNTPRHSYVGDWKKDKTGHWKECECGAKNNSSEHRSDGPATEDYAEVCYICGWEINPILNHTHTFSDKWDTDKDYHWHKATCGHNVVSDKAEHSEGTVKDNKCDVCGQALSTGDNTGSGTTSDSGSTGSGTGSGSTGNAGSGTSSSGGGGSYYVPSTSTTTDDITVSNTNSNISVEISEVQSSVITNAKNSASKDSHVDIIGGEKCAVSVSAEDKQGDALAGFLTPVTVEIPVSSAVLKTVDNISRLTLAKVVTDENGNTSLVYMGGNYDTQTGVFTAYADEAGDYVLVEDDDVQKIELQIGNRTTSVNGTDKTSDVAPRIIDNHTYVPLRYIAEILGCEVAWDEASRTVTITQNGITLKLVIDEEIEGYGVSAVIRESRTLVPLRYIAEQLGANVIWHPDTQEIVVVK